MNLDMRELLNGDVVRLRYVFRYSTSRVSHPESVAEHMYFVGFYALAISDWVQSHTSLEVNTGELLRRALIHDLEEARSGDFPRPFKHSDKKLKRMLDEASEHALEQLIWRLMPAHTGEDKFSNEEWMHTWRTSKDNSYEGRILEFCDFLSVLSFFIEEGAASSNRLIARHLGDMYSYFARFTTSDYDFIRPLVSETEKLLESAFPGGKQRETAEKTTV